MSLKNAFKKQRDQFMKEHGEYDRMFFFNRSSKPLTIYHFYISESTYDQAIATLGEKFVFDAMPESFSTIPYLRQKELKN